MKKLFAIALLVSGSAVAQIATVSSRPFVLSQPTLVISDAGAGAYGTALGDFNGDGVPDLVVINSTTNAAQVYLGTGNGTFASIPVAELTTPDGGLGAKIPFVYDLNNDGFQDIAVSNSTSNTVSVYCGLGNGNFVQAIGNPLTGVTGNQGIWAGELGSNLPPSIVTIEKSGLGAVVLPNIGDGGCGFLSGVAVIAPDGGNNLPASGSAGIIASDLNGDGYADLIISGNDQNLYTIFGTSSATAWGIWSIHTLSVSGNGGHQCTVNYFNADSVPDIACLVGSGNSQAIDVWYGTNTAANVYSVLPLQAFPLNINGSAYGIVSGDYNADGLPDIATAVDDSGNLYDGMQVLFNTGTAFQVAQLLTLPPPPSPIQVTSQHHMATLLYPAQGDLNRDGTPDLLAGNFYGNTSIPSVYSWLFAPPVRNSPSSQQTAVTMTPLNGGTFTSYQSEYICCTDAGTAFPTALEGRTSITVENYGPGAIAIGATSVPSPLSDVQVAAAGNVQISANSSIPLACFAVTTQLDGGCTAVQEVR